MLAHASMLVHTSAYRRIPAHTGTYRRIPAHKSAYRHMLAHRSTVYTSVYQRALVCTGVHRCALVHTRRQYALAAPREPGPLALGDGPLTPLALGDAATEVSAAVGVLAHDQATPLAAPEASPPPAQSGVTRAFRLLNSAVLLACALGLAAAPFRSIGLLLQIDLSVCPA